MSTAVERVTVLPEDQFNQNLVANVHPADWVNPKPTGRYNLVVIGGGTAGLITAAAGAALGAKVALIEQHLLGGDCLNVGCVPSKGIIRAARAYAGVRDAGPFGVVVPNGARVDFPAAMERMRRLRSEISVNDSAARFTEMGVDMYLGRARFTDKGTVAIGDQELQYSRAVIASGARAAAPPIPGLEDSGYLTNETIFSLTELPRRLAVIGAGPIGCEMAQSFARFGSEVHVLERSDHILPRENARAAAVVQQAMIHDGVDLILGCDVQSVESNGEEKTVVYGCCDGQETRVTVDHILVSVGRAPNVENLNLEAVGVEYDLRTGVKVNDYMQTTNRKIYAAGDVCYLYKFTHTAEALAAIVVQNALFARTRKASTLTIPWSTYTDPEVAHVGITEKEASDKGIEIDTYRAGFDDVDRAILDGEVEGFVEIHAKRGTDQILGGTIVASHAGEMISEITVAINGKIGLGTIASTIHPYPTQADAIKKAAREYYKTKLTPLAKKLMTRWLAWRR